MSVFQLNKSVSGEEYGRWRDYIESKQPDAILLPEFIDLIEGNEPTITFNADEEEE